MFPHFQAKLYFVPGSGVSREWALHITIIGNSRQYELSIKFTFAAVVSQLDRSSQLRLQPEKMSIDEVVCRKELAMTSPESVTHKAMM